MKGLEAAAQVHLCARVGAFITTAWRIISLQVGRFEVCIVADLVESFPVGAAKS